MTTVAALFLCDRWAWFLRAVLGLVFVSILAFKLLDALFLGFEVFLLFPYQALLF